MLKKLRRPSDYCPRERLFRFQPLMARREPAEPETSVFKDASDSSSHAWIESRGKVIGDGATSVGRYVGMLRL
ncbi:MAG: hypothetical protein OEN50_10440 [Deltaproteobacteria bacterium]|nr:hypothetical protein [Deltaproteobacteria bacterium]